MQTIKTALVVILLAAMFYGVYMVVNAPPPRAPKEVTEATTDMSPPLRVEEGDDGLSPAPPTMALGQTDSADQGYGASPVPAGALGRSPGFPPSSSFRAEESRDDRIGLYDSSEPLAPTPPAPTAPALTDLPVRPVAAPPLNSPPSDVPATTRETVDGATGTETPPGSAEDAESLRVAPTDAVLAPAGTAVDVRSRSSVDATNTPDTANSPSIASSTGDERGAAAPASYADGVRFDTKEAVFARGWRDAQHDLAQGHLRQALLTLSQVYEDPRLTSEDRVKLLESLDPLAGDVIYSTRHLLEAPYEIRRGDTLESVAEQFDVPWQLLQNINGVKNPNFLVPGEKLKVVRGPFRAEVDLQRGELTLFLNKYYAGRFPISVGGDPAPAAGEFEVKSKQPGRTYFSADGRNVPSGHPENPFGRVWLDLGKNVAIHGSAEKADVAVSAGCISLSPRDAQDVFAILSEGSRVTIRR